MNKDPSTTTHFGYETIPKETKAARVKQVFQSVSEKYDLMNDLMSLGLHRLWKHFAVGLCGLRPGQTVLDLAGGTGDLTAKISPLLGTAGKVVLADINESMLSVARARLLDKGLYENIEIAQANAECLPFPENTFDCIIIGFGLRNVTNKDQALASMYNCLKPGGRLIILEFSHTTLPGLKQLYDAYSFKLLPLLGKVIAKDEESYRYLAESIRMHPNQSSLKTMMETANFEDCEYHNLSGGIVALHKGFKY